MCCSGDLLLTLQMDAPSQQRHTPYGSGTNCAGDTNRTVGLCPGNECLGPPSPACWWLLPWGCAGADRWKKKVLYRVCKNVKNKGNVSDSSGLSSYGVRCGWLPSSTPGPVWGWGFSVLLPDPMLLPPPRPCGFSLAPCGAVPTWLHVGTCGCALSAHQSGAACRGGSG